MKIQISIKNVLMINASKFIKLIKTKQYIVVIHVYLIIA